MTHQTAMTEESGKAVIASFYTYTGGVGRTMAIANVSWILAGAGKRVLIVDWSSESPALRGYLEPFLADDELCLDADLALRFLSAEPEVPPLQRAERGQMNEPEHAIMLRRYDLPHAQGQIDVIGGPDVRGMVHAGRYRPEGSFLPSRNPLGDNSVRLLRHALKKSEYDYILIDCPSGPAEANVACTARLPDVMATFFRMGRATIAGAAREVNSIRGRTGRGDDLVVIPVPSCVDRGAGDRMQASRALISEEFARTGYRASASALEIPYITKYAHGDTLAALADEPGEQDTLLNSYELLTREITAGVVVKAEPIADEVRQRYRRAMVTAGGEHGETMFVAYAVPDRRWADWIRHQLELVGVRVEKLVDPATAERNGTRASAIIVVASDRFGTSEVADTAREWLKAKAEDPERRGGIDVMMARVDPAIPAGPFADLPMIELRHGSESVARTSLLSYFGLIRGAQEAPTSFTSEPRYPHHSADRPGSLGSRTTVRLPARNPSFVGRESALELVRDQLFLGQVPGPHLLRGLPGAGKSELAKEYAYRFQSDYDVVWWIPADTTTSVLASLAELTHQLDIPPSGDPAMAALRLLATENVPQRWLLVYDNADDLDQIRPLLPVAGSCHVLVTSRAGDAGGLAVTQVDPFSRQDSIDFLREYVPALADASAERVAEVVKDLPLALHMAGGWLRESAARLQDVGSTLLEGESLAWSAAEFSRRMQERLDRDGDQPDEAGQAATAAACTAVCFEALAEANLGGVSARLVELCSFMAADGVALRLIYSPEMVRRLTAQLGEQGDSVRNDTVLIDQVCWTASRYGLAEIRRDLHPTLRMHPLTQQLVRYALSPAEHSRRQADALAVLAAYAPPDAEEDAPEHDSTYAELHRHLTPSGALDSDDWPVRRWVVNQIRYFYRRYHVEMWQAARSLAERVLERGPRDVASFDDLQLRLAVQLANIYRALGRFEDAQSLDEQVLNQLRRTLTQLHPRTLMTARSHGGDLRGLGRFDEALAEDQSTVDGFRAIFGDDHTATLMAVHNLALSWFLTGDASAALRHEGEVLERRLRLFGEDDRGTWRAQSAVADYLREVGRNDRSNQILGDVIKRLKAADPGSAELMAAEKSLGITWRRLGRAQEAIDLVDPALTRYRATHGGSHPDTLSCALAQAANLYRAGRPEEAVAEARRCLAGYLSRFQEDHPFVYACQADLGIFLRASGDVAGAAEMTGAGLAGLSSRLNPWHPWVIAASMNHATSLLATGELEASRELDESAYAESRESLGPEHPCSRTALANLEERASRARNDLDVSYRHAFEIDIPQT